MAKKDRERRPTRRLAQEKRFLLVVEGVVTEPEYIEAVKRSRRMRSIAVHIETGHTEPIGIVNRAKLMMKMAPKTERYDQVWCVFDVEAKRDQRARLGLAEALDAGKRSGIQPAVSNPCFEIWLLWHANDQTGPIDSDTVQRRCVEVGITDGKHIRDANDLIATGFQAAKARALSIEQNHDRNGTTKPEDRNPSSGVYKLIDAIYAAFPPR
jgi:hypothetical protein